MTSSCRDVLVGCACSPDRCPLRADDDGRRCSKPRRLGELPLERAPRVVRVACHAASPAARRATGSRARAARPVSSAKKTSIVGGSRCCDSLFLQRDQQPLDTGPEADPGRRWAADLLDEVVVAAATRQRRVLVLERADELPGRARVVIEPANERRHERVADTDSVEIRANRREPARARRAQRVADLGCLRRARRALRLASSGCCRRRGAGSSPAFRSVSASSRSPCAASQACSDSRYAGRHSRAADRVELEVVARDAEPAEKRRRRAGSAPRRSPGRRFRSPRPTPASAPGSRLAWGSVAVHRGDREELRRLRLAVQAVLQVRTTDRRRALRSQGQRPVASGRRRCTSPSARRRSPRRRCARRAPCPRTRASGSAGSRRASKAARSRRLRDARAAARRGGCRESRGALDLDRVAHPARSARSSARNGLRASSVAERRRRTVARVDDGLGREALDERANRREERLPVGPRKIGATDRAGEEHVAGEEAAVGVVREVRRASARERKGRRTSSRPPRSTRPLRGARRASTRRIEIVGA